MNDAPENQAESQAEDPPEKPQKVKKVKPAKQPKKPKADKPAGVTRRLVAISAEIAMVLFGLCVVSAAIITWRLSNGPIEVGFARKYIESELSDPAHDLAVALGSVYLEWSLAEARPVITLHDVALINTQKKRTALAFETASISLSRQGLFFGQIVPRTITIEKPLIAVVRTVDNGFQLGFNQMQPESTEESDFFKILDELARPSSEAPRDWPLRHLQSLVITQASMMIEDHVLKQSWLVPKIEIAFRRGHQNLVMASSLWLESDLVKRPTLETEATYQGSSHNLTVQARVLGLRAAFLATKYPDLEWLRGQNVILNGTAQAQLGAGFKLDRLDATLESRNGQLMISDIYERPFPYQQMQLDMGYDGAAKTVTLRDSRVVMNPDFIFTLSGTAVETAPGQIHAPVRLHIETLAHPQVVAFWPSILQGQSSEKWALQRLSKGRLYDSDINAVISAIKTEREEDGEQKVDWSVDLDSMTMDFAMEKMDVAYSSSLMPVTEGDGRGHYDYGTDIMVIDVEKGRLGDLTIKSGKITIDTVYQAGIGTAVIEGDFSGPLKTVFDYIALDPIGIDDLPLDRAGIKGNVDFQLKVELPTAADLDADEIVVSADGVADDVLLPKLIKGLDVTGGPVKVSVKDGQLRAAGKGRVDGRETDFTYHQYFDSTGRDYSGQVVADLVVDEALRLHFGADLSDWIGGAMPARITYTERGGGTTDIAAIVDATPGVLTVKPMNYTKNPGAAGKISFRAMLEKGVLKSINGLTVEGPGLNAEGGTLVFAGAEARLSSGKFTRARLMETDVVVDFTLSAKNHLEMTIGGAFFDATPFLENNKKSGRAAGAAEKNYTGPSLVARVSAARMRTAEARMVHNAKIYADMNNQGLLQTLEMDAQAGRGNIIFRYRPDGPGNKMVLRIETDDAGAALQAFDVYENIEGGTLLVAGESVPGGNPQLVLGKAELHNFKVVNAPVLARLVNALSLPGIMQLLGSDGISFSRLEADFGWEMLRGGNLFTFRNGRTAGASMGLTFEGSVNGVNDTIAINGTIVPMSLVNEIIGSIPLVGQILSGGSAGGVFAATYSVRGPTKTPTTMVNPLAILTPGFLRRILFE